MSLYFIVEGRRTEHSIYPAWLSLLRPDLTRVFIPGDAAHNNYCLISGKGFPRLLHHIGNSILDVEANEQYMHLVIVVDVEDETIEEKTAYILDYIRDNHIHFNMNKLFIVMQNKTIETWLLANSRILTRNPHDSVLLSYKNFYNVSLQDPESMPIYNGFQTNASFHYDYLKRMLAEKNLCYTKHSTRVVESRHYLDQLIIRTTQNHILSFKQFYDFIVNYRSEL
jgi:hypothetical protein